MIKNVEITSQMIKAQSGEGAKLLSQLTKLDRNSKQARQIRRKLRKLGIKLSASISEQRDKRRRTEFLVDQVRKRAKRVSEIAKETMRLPRKGRRALRKKSIETPFLTRKERKKITGVGKLDQILDTAEVLVHKVGYKSKQKLINRLMEIYPKLTKERAEMTADKFKLSKNPSRIGLRGTARKLRILKYKFSSMLPAHPRYRETREEIKRLREQYHKLGGERRLNPPNRPVEIYDKVMAIEAQKGSKSEFPNQLFRHDFKKDKTAAKVLGLPDGSLLIKSTKGKRLWKEFDY